MECERSGGFEFKGCIDCGMKGEGGSWDLRDCIEFCVLLGLEKRGKGEETSTVLELASLRSYIYIYNKYRGGGGEVIFKVKPPAAYTPEKLNKMRLLLGMLLEF
ncbi:hypothetical protein BT93_B2236 [Corymbia citriodora subsp. variegata]|nr:hypothetical protein BT93_B2236 [Corymbia citriodora subsp. variegata]